MGEEKRSLYRKIKRVSGLAGISALIALSSLGGAALYHKKVEDNLEKNYYLKSKEVVSYNNAKETLDKLNGQRSIIVDPIDFPYINEKVKEYQEFQTPNLEKIAMLDNAIGSVKNDMDSLKKTENYKLYENNIDKKRRGGLLFLTSFFLGCFGVLYFIKRGVNLIDKSQQGEKQNA